MNTEDNYAILEAVIKCILAKWTTLNDIVEKGFGGPDSYYLRFNMEDDLLFNIKERWNSKGEKSRIYSDEIQDFLNQELEDNFNTICEDNAPREISEMIIRFYNECYQGNVKNANDYLDQNFEEASKQIDKLASYIGTTTLNEEELAELEGSYCSSSEEEMEEDKNTSKRNKKNEPDDDGWIMA